MYLFDTIQAITNGPSVALWTAGVVPGEMVREEPGGGVSGPNKLPLSMLFSRDNRQPRPIIFFAVGTIPFRAGQEFSALPVIILICKNLLTLAKATFPAYNMSNFAE
jgi:hypothetical protein